MIPYHEIFKFPNEFDDKKYNNISSDTSLMIYEAAI